LDLGAVDQGIAVLGIGRKDFIVEHPGLIHPPLLDEKLDVILLYLHVVRVIAENCGILCRGLIEVIGGVVKIAQHAIADGIVG